MKLAITDACIFIDLNDLQLTAQFFQLNLEIHTSLEVLNELETAHLQILAEYQSVGKLTTHIIKEKDRNNIKKKCYPKSLSECEKTVLYIASKLGALALSSDKLVWNRADYDVINFHGLVWIIEQLINKNLITKKEAIAKLKQLQTSNFVFKNNKELFKEMINRMSL